MTWRTLASTLFCGWLLWQQVSVDRELRHVAISKTPVPVQACVRLLPAKAFTGKTARPIVWYAATDPKTGVPNGKPEWFGCFPTDYDPRDDKGQ